MCGWVAIVSDRKSRIAHFHKFHFACTMLWLARQHLSQVPRLVNNYMIDRHTQTLWEVQLTIMADCDRVEIWFRLEIDTRSWHMTWISRRGKRQWWRRTFRPWGFISVLKPQGRNVRLHHYCLFPCTALWLKIETSLSKNTTTLGSNQTGRPTCETFLIIAT